MGQRSTGSSDMVQHQTSSAWLALCLAGLALKEQRTAVHDPAAGIEARAPPRPAAAVIERIFYCQHFAGEEPYARSSARNRLQPHRPSTAALTGVPGRKAHVVETYRSQPLVRTNICQSQKWRVVTLGQAGMRSRTHPAPSLMPAHARRQRGVDVNLRRLFPGKDHVRLSVCDQRRLVVQAEEVAAAARVAVRRVPGDLKVVRDWLLNGGAACQQRSSTPARTLQLSLLNLIAGRS